MNEELKKKFKEYAILFCKYTISGNRKVIDKVLYKINKIRDEFYLKSKREKKEFYKDLLNDDDTYVKLVVAIDCIAYDIFIIKSIIILNKISKNKKVDVYLRGFADLSLDEGIKKLYKKIIDCFSIKVILKKNKHNDELKESYIIYTNKYGEKIISNIANRNSENIKISKIYKKIYTEFSESEKKYLYIDLLREDRVYTNIIAASQCLKLNILVKKSKRVLKKISKDKYWNSTIKMAANVLLEDYDKSRKTL